MDIFLSDYMNGNLEADAVPAVLRALDACRNYKDPVLKLGGKTWNLHTDHAQAMECYISNNDSGLKRVAFPLTGFENLTIDGEGAELLFHGQLLPFVVQDCRGLKLMNFTIDYPRPQYFQGFITAAGEDFLELSYDPAEFNARLTDGMFCFACEEEHWTFDRGRVLCTEFEADTGAPSAYIQPYFACANPDAGHPFLKRMNCYVQAEEQRPGLLRMRGNFQHVHTVGNGWVCTFGVRDNPGIFCNRSSDIVLESVTFHAACSMGLICQLCHNITLLAVKVCTRKNSKRFLSINADATHFVNCTGLIRYDGCSFTGMMDDAGNIHGNYLKVVQKLDDHTLVLTYGHPQQFGVNVFGRGDQAYLVDNRSLSRIAALTVEDTWEEGKSKVILRTVECLPEVLEGFVIENYTAMPQVEIRNCIAGHNRPRGFLIHTNRRAVIENCTFFNMSYVIHIAGDCNSWYESGPVEDVLIRGNRFCNAAYTGGPAIAVEPNLTPTTTAYHKGIVIEDNLFEMHEERFLLAMGVENLTFRNNRFVRNESLPAHPVVGEKGIQLGSVCKDLHIEQPIEA